MIKLIDFIKESFYFDDISPNDQEKLYQLYKSSYEKSTGTAWSEEKFYDRAYDWEFFGDIDGYVAVREQNSGMYKLAVIGGNTRSILKGFQQLISLNEPVWGMVSKDILPLTKKLGFTTPNALTMNILLRIIPKEAFDNIDFKTNSDGSITLKYDDTGDARKYFIGNEQYFKKIKNDIKQYPKNKLKDLVKESKQLGDLYHFTPITNITKILKSQYLNPNAENQVSTSRRPNMFTGFQGEDHNMVNVPICRIMLDGDKISNKYKVKPFKYDEWDDLGEEAIITNGTPFYFMPYLKRIDIFTNKNTKPNQNKIDKIIPLLQQLNIPYKIYDGTPENNIPYNQPKTGNIGNIEYKPIPKQKTVNDIERHHPYPNFKSFYLQLKSGITNNIPQLNHTNMDITSKFPNFFVEPIDFFWKESWHRRKQDNPDMIDLIDNMSFKTFDELGMSDDLNIINKKLDKYFGSNEHDGLLMIPKNIIEKYYNIKPITPYSNKKTITFKQKQ
jgi:hypothetical protein